jgi:hypothetical protein
MRKIKKICGIKDVNGCTAYDLVFHKIEKEMDKLMQTQPEPQKALEAVDKDLLAIEEMLSKKN